MGRGLGAEQRRVLQVLTEVASAHGAAYVLLKSLALQNQSSSEVALQGKVNTSQIESARRAVRTLEQRGLVESRITDYDQRKGIKVVRLRRDDAKPADLPLELDLVLNRKLSSDNSLHNELLRRLGSRYRRIHVHRGDREGATLLIPGQQDPYRAIYLYPAEAQLGDHQTQEGLVEALDGQARESMESEVQRRVTEELERRGDHVCTCQASADDAVTAANVDPERFGESAYNYILRLIGEYHDILRDSDGDEVPMPFGGSGNTR